MIAYGDSEFVTQKKVDVAELARLRETHDVVWVDVAGLGDPELVASVGDAFGLHRLALEDVVSTHQRPKQEDYSDHVFIVARMLHPELWLETEQVSIFLGEGFLVTFQERPGDCFEPIRERLRHSKGSIRQRGADYLCYALLDAIIDGYFPALERTGETLELLEDNVVARPTRNHIALLHEIKRELLMLRRAVWPHREMINALVRDESQMISPDTRVYLRDCYDHTIQLMDLVETYREISTGLVDVYISSVSVKLNETMKVLTIIATIFIPLGFIASLYGMNFDTGVSPWNMPELHWRFGYLAVLAVMAATGGGLVWFFWRKGWIGTDDDRSTKS